MNRHEDRVIAVLREAVRQATKEHSAASGPLIRERVESCLTTALAKCKEDRLELYEMIDAER